MILCGNRQETVRKCSLSTDILVREDLGLRGNRLAGAFQVKAIILTEIICEM